MPEEKKKNEKIIKKKTRVSVSNTLNQMIFEQKDMNLQAFRMVMFYLAKINPERPEFTEVRVPLESYAEMLGVELNENAIDASTDLLMGYTLKTGEKIDGGYKVKNAKYNIFSVCRLLERISDGKRILEFKCSEDIKPLIFELQEKFTKFNVWNVLNLSNFQDIRMYMLLSQYKVAGSKTFTIEELKDKLKIEQTAYPKYKEFARTVLRKCQTALKERTDICFEFKSVGRPAHSVYFEISANDDYTILKYLEESAEPKQLPLPAEEEDDYEQLEMFGPADKFTPEERGEREEVCEGFQNEFFDEFTVDQLKELYELSKKHIDKVKMHDLLKEFGTGYQAHKAAMDVLIFEYVHSKILYCNAYPEPVKYRYKFIKDAVEGDWR